MLLLSVIFFAAVYFIPVTRQVDQTFKGVKANTGETNTQEISIQIKGEYHRYRWKPDTFTGYLRLEGYDYTFEDTVSPLYLTLNGEGQPLRYSSVDKSKGYPPETRTLGMFYGTAKFDQILILLLHGDAFNRDYGDYVYFSTQTAAQAEELFELFAIR